MTPANQRGIHVDRPTVASLDGTHSGYLLGACKAQMDRLQIFFRRAMTM
jgi:hypothetical protein